MQLIRAGDTAGAAAVAASQLAAACRAAVAARGRAVIALSGGETPWRMLERLRIIELPWDRVHVAQVDERIAPRGDPRRNLTRLEHLLVTDGPLPASRLHPMPVEATDPAVAADGYQRQLQALAGVPAVFDVVQLGLGADGHTASLLPGDPALAVADRDVVVSAEYQGLRRMTLTYPALDRARLRLWLVTGPSKAPRLRDLIEGGAGADAPALRVTRDGTLVVADEAALVLCRSRRGAGGRAQDE